MGKLRFCEKGFKKSNHVLAREILQRYLFFWLKKLIALYFIKSTANKKFIKYLTFSVRLEVSWRKISGSTWYSQTLHKFVYVH